MLRKQDSNKLLKGIKSVIFATSLAICPISVGAEEVNMAINKEVSIFTEDDLFKINAMGIGVFASLAIYTVSNNIIMDKYKEFDKFDEVNVIVKKKKKKLFNK